MMDFLAAKDLKEGRISGRTTWENDKKVRKAIKKRAVALLLDFEGQKELIDDQVTFSKTQDKI